MDGDECKAFLETFKWLETKHRSPITTSEIFQIIPKSENLNRILLTGTLSKNYSNWMKQKIIKKTKCQKKY